MPQFQGLTGEEVANRIASGQVNINPDANKGKSIKQIVLSNSITFFNILNLTFFVLIMSVGSYKNGLFGFLMVINTAIGIIQEVRTKKTLDELSILTAVQAKVIRDGSPKDVAVEEIVLDDIMVLETGDQIPSDSVVLSGEVEVNESMLTGESDNVMKRKDNQVLAGTYVTSGNAIVRVIHVGKDNYMETISEEAKQFKKVKSELRKSINKILKVISVIILPLCVGFFAKLYWINKESFRSAIEQVVSSGIGMIPEGLVLLTSIALTLGVLRLAKKRTLVQELYCIEALARVDVLCLDKTGTLTEGKMKVEEVCPFGSSVELESALRQMTAAQKTVNQTSQAIMDYFGSPKSSWNAETVIPFSSSRKYSGVSFKKEGTYYMGAAQFLFPEDEELAEKIKGYALQGFRVVTVAHSKRRMTGYELPDDLRAIGYVVLSDVIRKNCAETLAFFKEQGVSLRCISGDDPLTVSKIAEKCGLENASRYMDASTIQTKEEMKEAMRTYTVFGRVTPEQKKQMVVCLQEDGHTVAMTGDGVNDVMALKQADCSIAMASGAEATKHAANIVLLDSDFSSMPSVVKEGRRVINNICNASAMYLIKTTFSVLLTLATIIAGKAYPFEAVQLSVISGCAVGIPTFFMQMEPSFKQIKNNFMRIVFRNAVPAGITIAIACFCITNIGLSLSPDAKMMQTMCVLCTGWVYFFMLKRVYSPMTPYRRFIAYSMELVYIVLMIWGRSIFLGDVPILEFSNTINTNYVLVMLGIVTLSPILIELLEVSFDGMVSFADRRKEAKIKKRNSSRNFSTMSDKDIRKERRKQKARYR